VPTDVTRKIELNGSVLSKLSDATTGGNVWFYSPGGILVGAGAVIDVGGLLLSSIDLPNGFTPSSSGFTATFSKTQPNAGSIQVLSGAHINARNNYVALVGPRIEQGGNIQVERFSRLCAADGMTMTLSQGFFDIEVPVDQAHPIRTGSFTRERRAALPTSARRIITVSTWSLCRRTTR
jgi:hypothetical protein